ncbi:MAG TPA: sigma-70 family RNA polymerase sigma factor [Ktedonobacterales bacterium]|nr:sigma-70 family RNA polymerase sigma factor [Ktedonobacterales bacterium]
MAMARSPSIFGRVGARSDVPHAPHAPQAAQACVGRPHVTRPHWLLLSRWALWGRRTALTTARRDDATDPTAGAQAGDATDDDLADALAGYDASPTPTSPDVAPPLSSRPLAQANATLALSTDYETFIRQHERPILNYLWRMTGDEQAAYDLTQEVFLRAWQRFDAVRRYDQPRSWLFRVATNLAITHLHRRALPVGAATPLDALLDAGRDPASSDPAWRLAESDLVRRTLLQLAPRRRAALVLREVYGLNAAEVGQALGMTAVAVRMALHRAREQFRAIYLREEGTNADAD